MSIKDFATKINSQMGIYYSLAKQAIKNNPETLKSAMLALIIILLSGSSFLIGRLSVKEEMNANSEVVFYQEEESGVKDGVYYGDYVASKNGTSYHLPWCSGAKNISPQNLVIFHTKEEAEKAGYKAASNCKGI